MGCEEMTLQQQYDELYARVHRAIDWLDSQERNSDEIQRWMPEYEKLFWKMKALEGMMKNENVR